MANYSELLKDPRWQKKRLEILQRDGFKCQLCQDTETELHIHHKEYKYGNEPWEYGQENFTTYCKHCHMAIESAKRVFDFKWIVSSYKIYIKDAEIVDVYIFMRNDNGVKVLSMFSCTGNTSEFKFVLKENDLSDLLNKLKSY